VNASSIFCTVQDPAWLEVLRLVILDVFLPIIVAIITYIVVDRLGEWRKRRTYSRLGVAIIESLQQEIRTGIRLMTNALNATEDKSVGMPPLGIPPNRSWSGMSTIPDEVLLRIVETSTNRQFDGFPPRECRIHCKNYFEIMCQNYEQNVTTSVNLARRGQDWRGHLRALLTDEGESRYIQAARGVDQMLEHAKQLLEKNSRARFPK
jgi:hypothetical protein